MKKDEITLLLEEGLSLEEIPALLNLDELEEMIENADFDSYTSKKIKEGIKHLKSETKGHSKAFVEMLEKITKSDKNDY